MKLRNPKVRPHRITAEAIQCFDAGDMLGLHRALGLRPWVPSPLEVSEGAAPWTPGSAGAASWPLALELRRELIAASAAT